MPKRARPQAREKPALAPASLVERIVSGGQTGADRGGLDAAIALGIPHGGWCPKGRRAEDGAIPARYRLEEASSADYRVRTRKNVEAADGTAVFFRGVLSGGSLLTARVAARTGKPLLLIDLAVRGAGEGAGDLRAWIVENRVRTLNVAGPRESEAPGMREEVQAFLERNLPTKRATEISRARGFGRD